MRMTIETMVLADALVAAAAGQDVMTATLTPIREMTIEQISTRVIDGAILLRQPPKAAHDAPAPETPPTPEPAPEPSPVSAPEPSWYADVINLRGQKKRNHRVVPGGR